MVGSEFGHVYYLLSKQRSTLNIEHGDLCLKLTNLHPNSLISSVLILPIKEIIQELKVHFHL